MKKEVRFLLPALRIMFYAQSGKPLKKIGVRELNRNLYTYIKGELPFIITKDHKNFAIVIPYDQAIELLQRDGSVPNNQPHGVDSIGGDGRDGELHLGLSLWGRIKKALTRSI